jgi:hypothetical protein
MGLRSMLPTFNAVTGTEFLALSDAHRHLRANFEALRDRVNDLEKESPK